MRTRTATSVAHGALLSLAVHGCTTNGTGPTGEAEQALTWCPPASMLNGVDVSSGNGAIDWASVHGAGYAFAYMKATQGTGFTDSRFATYWADSHTAGVARGAYHFFDPTVDGVMQAEHFVAVMGTLAAGDLPPMLDIECPDGDATCLGYVGGSGDAPAAMIRSRMMDWLTTVQTMTGRTPIIYTYESYFADNAIDTTGLEAYPLYVANLSTGSCFTIPSPWTQAAIRQYSFTGTVAGIPGTVDLDHFFGTMADLATFGSGSPMPIYAAQYVMQSWPLSEAGAVMMLAGETQPAWIELRNTGTTTWDSNTRLATSDPRDRTSALAGSDWVMPDRPSAVTGTVAPGGTFRFNFTLQAPLTPGHFDEHFGVVEDGVAWFSDPGEGGPPDDQIEMLVDVSANPDAGIITDAGATGDSGASEDAEASGDAPLEPDAASDASSPADAAHDGSAEPDALSASDASRDGAASTDSTPGDGGAHAETAGCGCSVPGGWTSPQFGGLLATLAIAASTPRRRRRT